MPSHLDDSGQEHKKKKYRERGGTQAAIDGNDGADDLAKKGASLHPTSGLRYYLAEARAELTKITQDTTVAMWTAEVAY